MYIKKKEKGVFDFLEKEISDFYCETIVSSGKTFCKVFKKDDNFCNVHYTNITMSQVKFVTYNDKIVYYLNLVNPTKLNHIEKWDNFDKFIDLINLICQDFYEKGIKKFPDLSDFNLKFISKELSEIKLQLLKDSNFNKKDSLSKKIYLILKSSNLVSETLLDYTHTDLFDYRKEYELSLTSSNLKLVVSFESCDELYCVSDFEFRDSFDRLYYLVSDDYFVFETKTVFNLVVDELCKLIYKKSKEV